MADAFGETRPEIPIVFMTGYGDEDWLEPFRVIHKPFLPGELVGALAAALHPR